LSVSNCRDHRYSERACHHRFSEQTIIGFEFEKSPSSSFFFFHYHTHKEAAKVTPDGSHLARCVVIAYEAHAATWLATTAALVADPKGTTVHIIIRSVTDTRQEH
jgi:hypothetical protein